MGEKKVFIVDIARPWRPIREAVCPLVEGKKFVWADGGKHRHLIGGTAFFMRAGAERRKLHALEQIVKSGYLKWNFPMRWHAAQQAVWQYNATGEVL